MVPYSDFFNFCTWLAQRYIQNIMYEGEKFISGLFYYFMFKFTAERDI